MHDFSMSEQTIISARLGVPFSASPDLSKVKEVYEVQSLIEICQITIEGFGYGRIIILREDDMGENYEVPIRTPAGSVEVKTLVNNQKPQIVEGTLPISFNAVVYGQSEEILSTVSCRLIFNGEIFTGDPIMDIIEISDATHPAINFCGWKDQSKENLVAVLFPQDTDIFSKIKFVIEGGNTSSLTIDCRK
jgi:hypothetical protein